MKTTNVIVKNTNQNLELSINVPVNKKDFASLSSTVCRSKDKIKVQLITGETDKALEGLLKLGKKYFELVLPNVPSPIFDVLECDVVECGSDLLTVEVNGQFYNVVYNSVDGKVEVI